MSLGYIVILGAIAFGLYFVISAPQRRVTRNSDQADNYLALGGQALLVNDLDRASSNFSSALYAARQANHPLWIAEAYYGLSQVAAKRGDYKSAHEHICQALTQESALADGFDNYISLLKRVKEEYADRM